MRSRSLQPRLNRILHNIHNTHSFPPPPRQPRLNRPTRHIQPLPRRSKRPTQRDPHSRNHLRHSREHALVRCEDFEADIRYSGALAVDELSYGFDCFGDAPADGVEEP